MLLFDSTRPFIHDVQFVVTLEHVKHCDAHNKQVNGVPTDGIVIAEGHDTKHEELTE